MNYAKSGAYIGQIYGYFGNFYIHEHQYCFKKCFSIISSSSFFFLQFALVNLVKVVALKYCYRLSLSFVIFEVLKVLKQFEFAVLFCLIDFFLIEGYK